MALSGELGAGKTTFVQGFASALGIATANSPSYTLLNEYDGRCRLYHFDFYRLHAVEELADICFFDHIASKDAMVVVEWAEKFPVSLPDATIYVRIEYNEGSKDGRTIYLWTANDAMQKLLVNLKRRHEDSA